MAMPIVAIFHSPGLEQKNYEDACRELTGGKKTRIESPTDLPVRGLLSHAAGQGKDGFRVVDVWESEQSFREFGERLLPILEKLDIRVEPEIYPAYAFTCE
jgi:hypothetical protein